LQSMGAQPIWIEIALSDPLMIDGSGRIDLFVWLTC